MAVGFDAATWNAGVGSVTTFNQPVSVGNNGNRLLLAFISSFTAITSPTATWDTAGANQAMTLTTTQANVGTTVTCYMFRLVNPAFGSKLLTYSWTTASNNIGFVASSWFGVNQATPLYSSTSANGSTTTPTTTVNTVQTGDVAVGLLQTATHSLLTPSPFQAVYNPGFGTGLSWANGAGSNITLSGAAAASDNWISIGTAIGRALFAIDGSPTVMM